MLYLGVIGYPLEQSLSPQIHGAALYTLGISGEYRLYPIPELPAGAKLLEKRIEAVRSGGMAGLNVTIPHKQAVIPYLDVLTERARAIGAVNTIYRRDGQVWGDNTDAPGFGQDLLEQLRLSAPALLDLGGERLALVIGAGGAARAVVYALREQGWRVIVTARRVSQAMALAQSLSASTPGGSSRIDAAALDRPSLDGLTPQLIVNASSAGMAPQAGVNPWPVGLPLPAGAFLYDLVYKPPETALILAARQAGLAAVNGLGMLVEQAALSLEIWLECVAPRNAMRAALSYAEPPSRPIPRGPSGGEAA